MATTGTWLPAQQTPAKSGQPFKKNVSCILGITSASNTGNVSEVLPITTSAYIGGSKSGLPIVSTTWGRAKALSTGTFCYGPTANKWIMKANSVTTTISGVSNTVLTSGAADFRRRSIPYKLTARTAFLSTLQWNSNEIEGPTYTLTISASNPSFGNDVAAVLSATNRSSLFYMVTGKLATETSYPSLSLW